MSVIAIIGAGPLAGALAHKLATRNRVAEVRMIDAQDSIARGKALDIVQSGPIDGFATRVSAASSVLAAAGADVVVLADAVDGTEHAGEPALAMLRQLSASGIRGPWLFAGAMQRELMGRAIGELRLPAAAIVGSAPMALGAALRAMAALVLDTTPVEITLNVVGVPPRHAVIAWQEGTVGGQPLASALPAHHMAAIAGRVSSLWPPGPYALASAAAQIAEGLCSGSRRQFSCFVDSGRGRIAALPVELRRGGIKRVLDPSLTSAERTALETSLGA